MWLKYVALAIGGASFLIFISCGLRHWWNKRKLKKIEKEAQKVGRAYLEEV